MLVGNERIVAVLGAPGPTIGKTSTWWQVALTEYRILVVRMSSDEGQTWHTEGRWAKDRDAVAIGQYPRTAESRARMEIRGFPEHVVLMEIDQPDVHPHLAPFLAQWGAPVDGSASIPISTDGPKADEGKTDQQRLMALIIGGMAFIVLCCGCGSALVFMRDTLLGLLNG